MIPAAFDYERVDSVDSAIDALTRHGEDAKILAGGHSLLPLMRLRLATPPVLVDIGRIRDLSYITDDGDSVRIGALSRHTDLEHSELLGAEVPILAHAAGEVGDPQVRHRGTIGGSIAHGDPASDLPAVLLALRATIVARGPGGEREIGVDDFFTGFLETALAPDEILTEIRVPKVAGAGWSFQKFQRRAQDWAIVGVAAVVKGGSNGTGPDSGIGLVNMDSRPVRASASEGAVGRGASAAEAGAAADEGTNPPADLNATPEYRRHLSHVLVRRALQEAGV